MSTGDTNLLWIAGAVAQQCASLLSFEYLWVDRVQYRRSTKLPASDYVDLFMNRVQDQLDDESILLNGIGA